MEQNGGGRDQELNKLTKRLIYVRRPEVQSSDEAISEVEEAIDNQKEANR